MLEIIEFMTSEENSTGVKHDKVLGIRYDFGAKSFLKGIVKT